MNTEYTALQPGLRDPLAEAARFLEIKEFHTVTNIRTNSKLVPAAGGIYGWWFDDAFLPAQSDRTLRRGRYRLLYVGIAPRHAPVPGKKSRTLRDRLGNHCRGPIATSTLRYTLAALLSKVEGYQIDLATTGKRVMSQAHEDRLSTWMAEHARVGWVETEEPWNVEAELLQKGPRLPLNISGSKDPFRIELMRDRATAHLQSSTRNQSV